MDDLISRQVAIDAINHICPVDTEYDCTLLDMVDVRYVLLYLPSAQPEVVRCKDCNRAQEVEVFPGVKAQYNISCPLYHNMIFADEHYCAWGERKNNETD